MADTRDTIRTDILINAKASIQSLRDMSQAAGSNEERIAKFSSFLVQKSREWNIPLQKLLNTFKQLNAEMSKQHKATIFGNTGGKDIFGGAQSFLNAAIAADRVKVSTEGVVQSVRKVGGEMDNMGKKSKGAFEQVFTAVNAVRIALGAVISMLLFQGIQAVTGFVKESIKQFTELEDSLFRIGAAENALSKAGSEVSVSGLKQGITDLREELKVFSEEELTKLVGQLAILTKGLGLSEDQILALAKAAAIKNKISIDDESLDQTASKLVTTLLTGKSQGAAGLGVDIDDVAIKAKALEMQLLKAGESASDLSAKEKDMVKLQIILDSAAGDAERWADFLETNSAKLGENTASWEELQVAAGGFFATLIPAFTEFFGILTDAINMFKALAILFEVAKVSVANFFMAIFTGTNALDSLRKGILSFKDIPAIFDKIASDAIPNMFAKVPANAPDWFKNLFGKYLTDVETATDLTGDFQGALDAIDTTKAQESLEDMLKDLETLGEKIAESERDFQTKLTRFDDDALEDREKLVEDYNLNVQQTIRSFALRRAELEQKYRQNELDKEAKFQEQLRQLREKFLYNLEDALRERDARQVLRLIDQYNMDKTAMINEHNLEQELQQQQHQEELNDLKAQEAERLRVMAEEQAVRLQRQEEDSNLRRSRMLEDHAQEIADLMAQKEEILREAADKIAKEYELNEEGAKAIYDLLNKYYGGDGILEKLVADGYRGMLSQSEGFLSQLSQIIAMQQGLMAQASGYQPLYSQGVGGGYIPGAPAGGGSDGGDKGGIHGMHGNRIEMASGGQFIATRPTNLTVGEGNKPEIVSVIPLAKLLGGSLGINGTGGSNGMNGKIEVAVSLSAGLEAEIVNKAMDGVGEVVSRVNRSKG